MNDVSPIYPMGYAFMSEVLRSSRIWACSALRGARPPSSKGFNEHENG